MNTRRVILLFLLGLFLGSSRAQVIPVEILDNGDGSYTLLRGGEPYYIKGAGGTNKALFPELAGRGGNSLRTWGVDGLTRSILNEADSYGLTVMLGLWMKKEKDGFDYSNEEKVNEQLENFRYLVRSFKDHPALLAWSIGNEVDLEYTNLGVWNAVNDIARMIWEEDGNHPTLTITAGISRSKANAIAERAPDLDMLGVNAYGSISSLHSTITGSNWEKPYIITEWGVNGPWEVSSTSWGAPLEPNSSEKASLFLSRYEQNIDPHKDVCMGSYAFYWNSKFEATQTWFGLFVGKQTTQMIDNLQYAWTGSWNDNLAPRIYTVKINSLGQNQHVRISQRSGNLITVEASDPDEDTLHYEYLILPESGDYLVETMEGATYRAIPGIITQTDSCTAVMNFGEVHNNLNLRLYVLVRDGKGHVATATFPFQTKFTANTASPYPEIGYAGGYSISCKAWPNPFRDVIHILPAGRSAPITVHVLTPLGQIMYSRECEPIDREPVTLDLSRLPGGVYFLKFSSSDPGFSSFEKLLKE